MKLHCEGKMAPGAIVWLFGRELTTGPAQVELGIRAPIMWPDSRSVQHGILFYELQARMRIGTRLASLLSYGSKNYAVDGKVVFPRKTRVNDLAFDARWRRVRAWAVFEDRAPAMAGATVGRAMSTADSMSILGADKNGKTTISTK